MDVPMNYDGPSMEILVRDPKGENSAEVIEKLLSNVSGRNAKIGVFLKDKDDGDLTTGTLKALDDKGFNKVDLKDFMDKVHHTKIQSEVENLKVAASFVKWTFENIVNEVEDIIDAEKQVKHSQI